MSIECTVTMFNASPNPDSRGTRPVTTESRPIRRGRRWLIRSCLVVVAWYSFVGFFVPQLGSSSPMLPVLVRAALEEHARDVCEQRRSFGDVRQSQALSQLKVTRPPHQNSYIVHTIPDGSSMPVALIAYPARSQIPQMGLLYRILFLDKRKHWYRTYVLQSNGSFWRRNAYDIDSRHPPSVDVLDEFVESAKWIRERSLPMVPPCD